MLALVSDYFFNVITVLTTNEFRFNLISVKNCVSYFGTFHLCFLDLVKCLCFKQRQNFVNQNNEIASYSALLIEQELTTLDLCHVNCTCLPPSFIVSNHTISIFQSASLHNIKFPILIGLQKLD